MGSATNFCDAVADLHHAMEKNIIDKFSSQVQDKIIQVLLKEILIVEKYALLGKIQILVERETKDPSSSFQWQSENNIVQFQCHSCSKTFAANRNEASHLKSECTSNKYFTGEEFADHNLFEYSSVEQLPADTFNEDTKSPTNLISIPISDVLASSSWNEMETQGQLTCDIRQEDVINISKVIPMMPDEERNSNEHFSHPVLTSTYTHAQFPMMKHTQQQHRVEENLVCPKRLKQRRMKSLHCKHCNMEIDSTSPLNSQMHIKVCDPKPHPRGKFKCRGCDQMFASKKTLHRHNNICIPPRILNCI